MMVHDLDQQLTLQITVTSIVMEIDNVIIIVCAALLVPL